MVIVFGIAELLYTGAGSSKKVPGQQLSMRWTTVAELANSGTDLSYPA
jgi:hypothetical protein